MAKSNSGSNTTTCLSWSGATYKWSELNITWREACVIATIALSRGRGKTKKDYSRDLTKDQQETLINLIVRIKEGGYLYQTDEKKTKREEIKVTMKDIKLFIKELRQIKVKARI